MCQADSRVPPTTSPSQADEVQVKMRQVERGEWWLWSYAILVTLLLTLGVASFAFPALLKQAEPIFSFYLSQAVRALVGLVLLFNIYTIYQQLQINRIRRGLTEQMSAVNKVGVLAEEVYKLAVLGPLTGLYNRRSGEQRLAEEIARSRRHGRPLTVLLLDLNGLKQVNDKYGHAAGDLMLKVFAEQLNKAIGGSNLAVRLGGDEFLVLLPECRPEEVRHVLGRLSGLKMNLGEEATLVSFSAGWTNYSPGESPKDLLKRADEALYANKRIKREQEQPTRALV